MKNFLTGLFGTRRFTHWDIIVLCTAITLGGASGQWWALLLIPAGLFTGDVVAAASSDKEPTL